MRPQTCSATSLDTHRRALSRRPGAFFLATWTFLRHDSWAATYVYLQSSAHARALVAPPSLSMYVALTNIPVGELLFVSSILHLSEDLHPTTATTATARRPQRRRKFWGFSSGGRCGRRCFAARSGGGAPAFPCAVGRKSFSVRTCRFTGYGPQAKVKAKTEQIGACGGPPGTPSPPRADTLWGPRAGPEEHTRKASDVHRGACTYILFARTRSRTRITVTEPHTHRHTGTYTLYTLYKTADVTLTIKRGRGAQESRSRSQAARR